jgi:nitroimidazol reductase NimA-like FMN-containing flavoprotein (pyridoxamine 5'-phosphate oxidase superfamily)
VPVTTTTTPAGGIRVEAQHPADRLEPLDRQECLELLSQMEVGRIGFVVDGQPRIEPVNYRVVAGDVVFVSRPGAKLDAAVQGQRVAFEIDAVEEWARAGWSVLAVGVASLVSDPADVAELAAEGPEAWAHTAEVSMVRIAVSDLTGRRVRVHAGGVTLVRQDPDVPRPAW